MARYCQWPGKSRAGPQGDGSGRGRGRGLVKRGPGCPFSPTELPNGFSPHQPCKHNPGPGSGTGRPAPKFKLQQLCPVPSDLPEMTFFQKTLSSPSVYLHINSPEFLKLRSCCLIHSYARKTACGPRCEHDFEVRLSPREYVLRAT